MYDVICVGSATIDEFLTIHQKLESVTYGSKVLVKHLETHTGGGGTNSAVAIAKFGLKVAYLGKLGDDFAAKTIEKELHQHHIDLLNHNQSLLHTDQAFILNSEQEKDRIIYVHKGSSEDLKIKDLPQKLDTHWFYLGTLVNQAFSVLTYLFNYAQKNNINTLFNPSSYLAKQGLKKLTPLLKKTNFLILNQEEARLLLNSRSTVNHLLKKLTSYVREGVIITNGSQQLHALYQGQLYTLTPPKVKIKHTAGAGDAFNSAFLAAIIKNYSFADALKLAQANASSVIQHLGTKNRLLTEKEAKKLIKTYKIKVNIHEI